MDRKLRFLASPIHFITIANLVVMISSQVRPDAALLHQRFWYVESDKIQVIIFGVAGSYFGIFCSRLRKRNIQKLEPQVSNKILHLRIERYGYLLFYLSIISYLIWILFDFRGWLGRGESAHLRTLPGLTTMTQLMPLSISCLCFVYRMNKKDPKLIVFITVGIVISVYRSFVNQERLTVIEAILSVCLVLMLTSTRKIGISFRKLYIVLLLCTYSIFSIGEYFRSWEIYRYRLNQNFFQFSFERLVGYYTTSINNGAIYYDYHYEITNIPIYTFNFIWNFPILGEYFTAIFENGSSNLTVKELLLSSMDTDEFNNISPYLQIPAEVSIWGSFFIFGLVLFLISVIYNNIRSNSSWQIPLYSVLVVGLLEFPRIFWFGSGRAFPMIAMVLGMYISLSKLDRN